MNLVIVESPTKARTLKRYLGDGYQIEASMGHIRDLPKSKLGVDVEKGFEPDYTTVRGKGKIVKKLKKEAKKADTVFLAMDPDREGEAIAWHVHHLVADGRKKKKDDDKFQRVTFHEITKDAILKAMEKPGSVNMDLVDAQQARRVLDRLVGYKLSPLLWKKVRRGLSAGRVQSVALRMIVEREAERDAFEPQEYWQVEVALSTDDGVSKEVEKQLRQAIEDETQGFNSLPDLSDDGVFVAELVEFEGKKIEVKDPEKDQKGAMFLDKQSVVKPIVSDLKKADYVVSSIERKERKRHAYPPFITSTLQRRAATRLGMSGKQTMRLAQKLYEAGFITYHRTDSVNLSKQAITAGRKEIAKKYGKEYLPEKPNHYKTKSKSAQEAHEAIRPTQVDVTELPKKKGLDKRTTQLYKLIWQRFIASQMKSAIYDQTSVEITAAGDKKYGLRASGSILKFAGWRQVYLSDKESAAPGDSFLPELSEKDPLFYQELAAEQKETQPPPRYNDASLVKELEKKGIGRPSTYASIISVLEDRGYVMREGKQFNPTVIGKTVVKFLVKHFPSIMDYDFTAGMEDDLDHIATGDKKWQKVLATFWDPFADKLETVEDKAERMKIPEEKTDRKCPECGEHNLVIKMGRYGKFYACPGYPDCKHTEQYVEKLDDFECPDCGGDVVIKRTRRGKPFYGCSNYPKCEWASWKDPREKQE